MSPPAEIDLSVLPPEIRAAFEGEAGASDGPVDLRPAERAPGVWRSRPRSRRSPSATAASSIW